MRQAITENNVYNSYQEWLLCVKNYIKTGNMFNTLKIDVIQVEMRKQLNETEV